MARITIENPELRNLLHRLRFSELTVGYRQSADRPFVQVTIQRIEVHPGGLVLRGCSKHQDYPVAVRLSLTEIDMCLEVDSKKGQVIDLLRALAAQEVYLPFEHPTLSAESVTEQFKVLMLGVHTIALFGIRTVIAGVLPGDVLITAEIQRLEDSGEVYMLTHV